MARRLATALIIGCLAIANASVDDTSALVQAGVQRRGAEDDLQNGPWNAIHRMKNMVTDKAEPLRGNDCTCVNWKGVYLMGGNIKCGDALELYTYTKGANDTATKDKVLKSRGEQMCRSFYNRLDNNYCMNVGQTHEESEFASKQWCYVDSQKCGRLNGGEHVKGTKWSTKFCGDSDSKSRDQSVEELAIISHGDDVDMALLLRMAYPVHQYWAWWYAQSFWGLNAGRPMKSLALKQAETDMDPQLRDDMRAIDDASKPMVFLNQEEGEKPFGIVHKGRIYEIMDNKAHAMIKHPRTWSKLLCVKGCEDSSVVKTNSAATSALSGGASPQQQLFAPPMFMR